MGEIFANFSIAATIDSDQGIYGFSNLDLNPSCGGSTFCRITPADTNSDWSTPWSSTGHTMEGWGIRSFKFTPGAASPAPLTLRVTSDVSNFDGVLVYKSTADGLWSTQDLDFTNNVATGLIQGSETSPMRSTRLYGTQARLPIAITLRVDPHTLREPSTSRQHASPHRRP